MYFIFQALYDVYQLSFFTIFLSIFLDTTLSINSTLKLIQENPKLYLQGIMANYLNLLLLSPLYYIGAYVFLLNQNNEHFNFLKYIGLILIQNIGYYKIHEFMHKNRHFTWIHDFHHLFVITTPSSGNAVSCYEFQFAYLCPFLLGALLFRPNSMEFRSSIITISLFNLFIHTQELRNLIYPSFLVSPQKHCVHHETKSNTYSAPLLNLDYLLHTNKFKKN